MSAENVEAAFEIQLASEEIKNKLLKELKNQLTKRVDGEGYKLNFEVDLRGTKTGFDIFFFNNSPRYKLRFEFSGTECVDLCYGFKAVSEPYSELENEIKETLDNQIGPAPFKDTGWAWWRDMEKADGNDLKNWKTSPAPWSQIKNGKLVEHIIGKANGIRKAFEVAGKLELLQ